MDEKQELPLGFGMALARNEAALERFAALSDVEKQAVIAGAHTVRSKQEMRQYVETIGRSE